MKGISRKRSCYVLCPPRIIIIVVKVPNMRNLFLSLCTPIRYIQIFFFCILLPYPCPGDSLFRYVVTPQSSIGSVCSFTQFVYNSRRPIVVSKRVSISSLHTRVVKYHHYTLGIPILRSPVIETDFFWGGGMGLRQITFWRGEQTFICDSYDRFAADENVVLEIYTHPVKYKCR